MTLFTILAWALPTVIALATLEGLILTFIAGILPGIRAARLPITSGLREL